MGVGLPSFANLAWLATVHPPSGDCLMLGRQKFRLTKKGKVRKKKVETDDVAAFDSVLQRVGLRVSAAEMVQDDGYAETMFEKLGFGRPETLDYSDFEGAQRIWDLNQPVPEDWRGRFGFIFDGGTLEHVFDVRQSFDNMFDLLADDGIFVSATPLNNWPEHGFYQFTPELAYSYWTRTRGCEMLRCVSCTTDDPEVQHFPDPLGTGTRLKVKQPRAGFAGIGRAKRLYMWYAVRKPAYRNAQATTLQSDYTVRWTSSGKTAAQTDKEAHR